MHAASFSISADDLWNEIGADGAPSIVDVRRRDVYDSAGGVIPGAAWRDPEKAAEWAAAPEFDRRTVIACKAGHENSQLVAAQLRERGVAAQILAGGYAAWEEAGLPLVSRAAIERFLPRRPSLWVTRRRPKIDRVACPWLIRRFIDPQARFLFVDPPQVTSVARAAGAIPFDIEGVEIGHSGERCSFDTLLSLFGLDKEPSLAALATIVRGADTARHDLVAEAAGLHAVSLGLSALAGDDDHGLLRRGLFVYDGLLAWLRFASQEKHNWPARTA
jgi:rhodanese-related sulfurtransferase